jgi:hypothetical protein
VVSWFRVAACAGVLTMAGFVGSAAACVHSHHATAHERGAHPGSQVSARLLDLRPGSLRRFGSELRPHHTRSAPTAPVPSGPPAVPAPPSGDPLVKAVSGPSVLSQPAIRRE